MFRLRCSLGLLSVAALLVCVASQQCFAQGLAQVNLGSAQDNLGLEQDSPSAAATSKSIPLSSPSATTYQRYDTYREVAQQQIRERVQFEARQRVLRADWNEWIGYWPGRPTVNASYMSNGLQKYYIPARGQIVNNGTARAWYW